MESRVMPMFPLILLQGVILLSFLGLLLWTAGQARRTKRAQDRLVESLGQDGVEGWVRVMISRSAHFATPFKMIGFEARGLLVNLPDRVRILAELPNGERLDRSFPKRGLGLRWIGNPGLASSNLHWIALGSGPQELMVTADTGFNALQSREMTADICRRIEPSFRLPELARREFALEKNPASLGVVVLFFGLLGFAIIDGLILNNNQLVAGGWLRWGMPLGILFGPPVYWWLTRSQVPSRESLTLAMLVSMVAMGAYLPAIKRVDQLLAPEGVQSYAYRLETDASLEPLTAGPPPLCFHRDREYWAQFEEGSTHHFDLTHGPLGLWQLDHQRLDQELRRFYRERRDRDG
jgi:hypothetical protein